MVQLKWSPISPNACHKNVMKLGYEEIKEEIKTIILSNLSGKLSCNWLIMLVTMATPFLKRER